jgi:hypothetical protein
MDALDSSLASKASSKLDTSDLDETDVDEDEFDAEGRPLVEIY